MEVQHFQIQLYLAIRFGLIFLVMSSNAMPTTNEEHTCRGEKYITNTFFKKHDILIDSQFEEFIENEISLGLCQVLHDKPQFVPTLLAVHRNLIGEGSHRQLSSSIIIKMQGESASKLSAQSCQVIMVERLPSGVFADPFQLQHLVQRGVFSNAAVLGDTNLELPSFRSNRSVVELHMDMGSNVSSGCKDELEVNLGLPLHARYAVISSSSKGKNVTQSNIHDANQSFIQAPEGHYLILDLSQAAQYQPWLPSYGVNLVPTYGSSQQLNSMYPIVGQPRRTNVEQFVSKSKISLTSPSVRWIVYMSDLFNAKLF
ncbi:phosphatidylinositol-glycan biosynthesis class X protein [Forsythia ovata]|uniref:Phosphatidylinositol-glycan biosynthesis class X protein n=1 Tax=Forsythia ovata TaxID=205694 RepID=A0ABD1WAH2_9LAMI